jgi:hypothetical protein
VLQFKHCRVNYRISFNAGLSKEKILSPNYLYDAFYTGSDIASDYAEKTYLENQTSYFLDTK